jgi:predicted exporter
VRYVVVARGASREAALLAAQALSAPLAALVDSGVLRAFSSPSQYLPAQATQRARLASLPPRATLAAHLQAALTGLPVAAAQLAPFLQEVEAARSGPLLAAADLAGTSLASAVDALLVRSSDGWSALLPVAGPGSGELSARAVEQVRGAIAHSDPPGILLDLKGEADQLYSGYLQQALTLAAAGFAAIVVLLLCTLRAWTRLVRVVLPLALAVLAVFTLLVGLGRHLSIMHIVGMLLIVAVGSNYALFFDRAGNQADPDVPLTLASLVVANLATVLAFGVLGCANVPVLADLGMTVAPGALLALFFAGLLARPLATDGPHP